MKKRKAENDAWMNDLHNKQIELENHQDAMQGELDSQGRELKRQKYNTSKLGKGRWVVCEGTKKVEALYLKEVEGEKGSFAVFKAQAPTELTHEMAEALGLKQTTGEVSKWTEEGEDTEQTKAAMKELQEFHTAVTRPKVLESVQLQYMWDGKGKEKGKGKGGKGKGKHKGKEGKG